MPTYGDNTTSNSRYFQKGVFVDKCKVQSVEDVSNYPKKQGAEIKVVGQKGWQPELCLKLSVNTGIEMDMYVMGRFQWKTDPISGKKLEYQGWKQRGNGVQNLLYKLLGEFKTDEFDAVPQALLNRLVGLEFYRLRYCQNRDKMYEGKPSFQTWNIFERVEEGNDDKLYREWLKVAPNRNDYDPNLWDEYQEEQQSSAPKPDSGGDDTVPF